MKAAYEKAMAECTRLEKEIEEKDRTIEKQNKIIEEDKLTIEHLKEMLLKRNKMIFGRKSEKSKYLSPDESIFRRMNSLCLRAESMRLNRNPI